MVEHPLCPAHQITSAISKQSALPSARIHMQTPLLSTRPSHQITSRVVLLRADKSTSAIRLLPLCIPFLPGSLPGRPLGQPILGPRPQARRGLDLLSRCSVACPRLLCRPLHCPAPGLPGTALPDLPICRLRALPICRRICRTAIHPPCQAESADRLHLNRACMSAGIMHLY
jgi:hypothetical protein